MTCSAGRWLSRYSRFPPRQFPNRIAQSPWLTLAGTELPLILREGDGSVPLLDTTRIHVRGVVRAVMRSE